MQGSLQGAPRIGRVPAFDAHVMRVCRWPARHLRGESKLAWIMLYARNGYRLGTFCEHVYESYLGELYNAADPRSAGETVLKNLQRVHLVRCRVLAKTMELTLEDTEQAFRSWTQELGVVLADPQGAFPFTEELAEESATLDEAFTPTVALTPPGPDDGADAVAHDRSRMQGGAGVAPRGIPAEGYPGEIPGGENSGKSPGNPRLARSSSFRKEFNSFITHPAQRSSSFDEDLRATESRSGDFPGISPAGLSAIGDVAGGAIARLLDDEHWERQRLARRDAVAAQIRAWVRDPGMYDSEVLVYASLVVEGRLKIEQIQAVAKAIDRMDQPPRSRGAVFNALIQRRLPKDVNLKAARKEFS